MKDKESQNKQVLRFLRMNKTITLFQAQALPGIIMRLSARIYDLKYKGYLRDNESIITHLVTSPRGKRYGKYELIKVRKTKT